MKTTIVLKISSHTKSSHTYSLSLLVEEFPDFPTCNRTLSPLVETCNTLYSVRGEQNGARFCVFEKYVHLFGWLFVSLNFWSKWKSSLDKVMIEVYPSQIRRGEGVGVVKPKFRWKTGMFKVTCLYWQVLNSTGTSWTSVGDVPRLRRTGYLEEVHNPWVVRLKSFPNKNEFLTCCSVLLKEWYQYSYGIEFKVTLTIL